MGYYSTFHVTALNDDGSPIDQVSLAAELSLITAYTWSANLTLDLAKWYDHDHDMRMISTHYQHTSFMLHSVGEDGAEFLNTFYRGMLVDSSQCYS